MKVNVLRAWTLVPLERRYPVVDLDGDAELPVVHFYPCSSLSKSFLEADVVDVDIDDVGVLWRAEVARIDLSLSRTMEFCQNCCCERDKLLQGVS